MFHGTYCTPMKSCPIFILCPRHQNVCPFYIHITYIDTLKTKLYSKFQQLIRDSYIVIYSYIYICAIITKTESNRRNDIQILRQFSSLPTLSTRRIHLNEVEFKFNHVVAPQIPPLVLTHGTYSRW